MIRQGLALMVRNALTGLRASSSLVRWLVLRRDPEQAAKALSGHRELSRGKAISWLVVQAVLGPGVLALSVVVWLTALIAVTSPLWWWFAPPSVVFVPITDLGSSFIGALYGVPLVLIAVACGHGLPRWQANVNRALLTGSRTRRIEVLTKSRAGALEVQAAELLRIERDLHDGAQARLVSAGMLLGLLDFKLGELPADRRKLLADARFEVGEALQELRDLVHGVYPPILVDRGLAGGIESLAERAGPLVGSVTAAVDVADRLPAAVESTVYFVVAEALNNVTKHSHAKKAEVTVYTDRQHVRVEVRDDGRGGADELRGSGLAGLRRRVAAFDGTLTVTSPGGGPTVLRAELPCVS